MRQTTMLRWIEEADAKRVCALARERSVLGVGAYPRLEPRKASISWTVGIALSRYLRRAKGVPRIGALNSLPDSSEIS